MMSRKEVYDYAVSELTKHGLTNWRVSFNRRKSSIGVTNKKEKTISFSIHFIDNIPRENMINTILHEIAHAIDFERRGVSDHSWRWKIIAKEVGCSAERCSSARVSRAIPSKYTYICQGCGVNVSVHRRLKNLEKRYCGRCRGKFIERVNW